MYRAVTRLALRGVVHVLPHPGRAMYGAAEADHQHAICTHCGNVIEIDSMALQSFTHAWQDQAGFLIALCLAWARAGECLEAGWRLGRAACRLDGDLNRRRLMPIGDGRRVRQRWGGV